VFEVLFWLYLCNSVLLIVHEIDSAYWKEWELFKLPGGTNLFLILHLPLAFLLMYGLVLVFQEYTAGLVFSLIFGMGGMFAFTIHTIFIRMGRSEFKVPVSLFLLVATLMVSLVQVGVSIYIMAT
jgi:hypothetical protein